MRDKSSLVVQSVGGNSFGFDEFYAECWSKKQGDFSFQLANNFIKYLKANKNIVGSVLDICSGTGEFLTIMRNVCTDCVGVDVSDAYLNYSKRNHPDVEFMHVDSLSNFNLKRKFNLISCNRDVVNMFTNFNEWKTFFKTVSAHLENNGMFLFDFYTEKKLSSWQGVFYDESNDLDYVSKVSQNNGLCVMSEIYYIKKSSIYFVKTKDVMVEAGFKLEDITKALNDAGFKKIRFVNSKIEEIPQERLDSVERIHIIAEK